jgi:catechol 2,3-dioxygenase-like lactoylglutathione lyase family enzyme
VNGMKTAKLSLVLCSMLAGLFIVSYYNRTIYAGEAPMLDHTSISVKDYAQSLKFYDETLKILGYDRLMTFDHIATAGYGANNKPSFWISSQGKSEESIGAARGVHFAFRAPNRAAVDTWYAKALELGGTDNGKPGLRPQYHADYYGAFIIDPNGWRIEACCHHKE